MVRSGRSTSAAGMVADSSPRNAHRVSVAVAEMAEKVRAPAHVERDEVRRVEERQPERADGQEGEQLERGRDELDPARLADPARVDPGEEPDRRDGDRGGEGGTRPESRREEPQVAHHRHRDGRVPRADGEPVPPGDEERREVTEGGAGVGVRPAGARVRAGETREGEREEERARGGEAPADETDPAVGAERRGEEEDPRADHVPDDEGGGHPQPELPAGGAASGERHPPSRGGRGCAPAWCRSTRR